MLTAEHALTYHPIFRWGSLVRHGTHAVSLSSASRSASLLSGFGVEEELYGRGGRAAHTTLGLEAASSKRVHDVREGRHHEHDLLVSVPQDILASHTHCQGPTWLRPTKSWPISWARGAMSFLPGTSAATIGSGCCGSGYLRRVIKGWLTLSESRCGASRRYRLVRLFLGVLWSVRNASGGGGISSPSFRCGVMPKTRGCPHRWLCTRSEVATTTSARRSACRRSTLSRRTCHRLRTSASARGCASTRRKPRLYECRRRSSPVAQWRRERPLAGVPQITGIVQQLLAGNHSTVGGRLAGAFRHIGREGFADEIGRTMWQAGYDAFREVDPFVTESWTEGQVRYAARHSAPPIVHRLGGLWARARDRFLLPFPAPLGLQTGATRQRYLDRVSAAYLDRHSLSIEGLSSHAGADRASRSGAWDPDGVAVDRLQRDALAARAIGRRFSRCRRPWRMSWALMRAPSPWSVGVAPLRRPL